MFAEPPIGSLFHRLAECTIAAATHDHCSPGGIAERNVMAAIIREAVGRASHDDLAAIGRDTEEVAVVLCGGIRPTDSWQAATAAAAPAAGVMAGRRRQLGDGIKAMVWLRHCGLHNVKFALHGVTRHQWSRAWDNVRRASHKLVSWSRAIVLAPRDADGDDRTENVPDEGTFDWVVKPPHDTLPLQAVFYTDGSAFEGRSRRLRRLGWSFVAVGPSGQVVASACGAPPPWIDSVAGAEAWALVQAATAAKPGAVFKTDCQAVLKAVTAGRARATAHDRPLARVMGLLHARFDDPSHVASLVWMLGHSTKTDVGRAVLSDGSFLSSMDLVANARADRLAKSAAAEWRASPAQRAAEVAHRILVLRLALHTGKVT